MTARRSDAPAMTVLALQGALGVAFAIGGFYSLFDNPRHHLVDGIEAGLGFGLAQSALIAMIWRPATRGMTLARCDRELRAGAATAQGLPAREIRSLFDSRAERTLVTSQMAFLIMLSQLVFQRDPGLMAFWPTYIVTNLAMLAVDLLVLPNARLDAGRVLGPVFTASPVAGGGSGSVGLSLIW